ncbi:MAG: isoprenyl transferase [Candidatus Marinimicrobia bacterium]|nr:isoprenyl transferase [Candidatus Neomarinimicrobiota bacterium]MCF7829225.1 isoprenyl transferase [Candidatus Neomarinimicrobiota bacterium]MCF7881122.1 isoprenyl transferase [Candidatus Neomarinimicrobiota bacterium]
MTADLESLEQQIQQHGRLPSHIAIIMDGNGRWAKERSLPRLAGHNEGINSVREIVRACGELGVEALTLYTFSKENWNRPPREVTALMKLLLRTIRKEVDELMANNVKIRVIGDLEDLPPEPRQSMKEAMDRTANNTGLQLNLALSYGGRSEILEAVEALYHDIQAGKHSINELDENLFSSYMHTGSQPDPDLLIRTSGEARISNFLLWQLAYTELYITSVYWPDFRREELYKAILDYQSRERRFGKVSEQIKNKPLVAEQS